MTPEAFATAMAGFGPAPGRVAVAVSGGPHSLALALLTGHWAAEHGVALTALVAEHGLRRESAEEAAGVAAMLAGQGITTRVIPLGLRGGASIQARARAIQTNRDLPAADRATQLAALQAEATAKLTTSLTPRGLAAYKENGGYWLENLKPRPLPASPATGGSSTTQPVTRLPGG
jgi:tRNA(Ile)-lysidine synthase